MSSSQRERLVAESAEEREVRLQHNQESHRERRVQGTLGQLHLPLIQQHAVQAKMRKFHAHMAALEVSRCSTCSEAFPGLHLHLGSTECVRCSQDKHIHPKCTPPAITCILAPSRHNCR